MLCFFCDILHCKLAFSKVSVPKRFHFYTFTSKLAFARPSNPCHRKTRSSDYLKKEFLIHKYQRIYCVWNNSSGVWITTVPLTVKRQFLCLYYDSSGVCKTTVKGTLKKLVFVDFFSRCWRVLSRYNIATQNIAFSKTPLKTEVFRGSLK